MSTGVAGQHEAARAGLQLPDGWQWVRLRGLIREAQPGFACGERDAQGVVQLRMNNVDTQGRFVWKEILCVPADPSTIERFRLVPGDVLFNNTNSTELVGKSALFDGYAEPVVYSNHFTRLRTDTDALLPAFLAAWINHQWQRGVFASICNRWIGQSAVKADKLLALLIPLPPPAEQRRIVAVLSEQLAAVEKARAAAETGLRAANELLPAHTREVLSSNRWPHPRLGDLCRLVNGDAYRESEWSREGVPIVRIQNLNDATKPFNYWTGPLDDRVQIDTGAVLLAWSGTPGTSFGAHLWTRGPAVLNQHIFRVDLDEGAIQKEWAVIAINEQLNVMIASAHGAVGLRHVTKREVQALRVPLPPLEDQQRLARQLAAIRNTAESIQKAFADKLRNLTRLRAAVLRRAFAGGL